jgi:hypothetical protein
MIVWLSYARISKVGNFSCPKGHTKHQDQNRDVEEG